MKRRDALKGLAALSGHALFPTVVAQFLQACSSPAKESAPQFFTADEMGLLAELVDAVIPTTDTPGAKEANVHVFIDLCMQHCTSPEQQRAFRQGMKDLQTDFESENSSTFLAASPEMRIAGLEKIEQTYLQEDRPFLKTLKELTLSGYLHTEAGASQFAEYVHVPGGFKGCIDMTPEQRVWAT